MKLALLCSVAFLAATSPVLAADLVQPVATMPFSWTGFYVGGQAGGGWNDSRWSGNGFPTFNTNGSGGIFGGQIGYNWQIDQYVIGIEGDFSGSTVKGDNQCAASPGTTCETKQDYLGSVRGRLGYAVDRFMIYGDAGVAFTKYKFAEVDLFPQSFGGGSRVGWTAGLGVEYALTDHWTAGVEWNYYDFGSKSGESDQQPGFFVDNRDTQNVVVGKINYKF
ncbi:outer membrane protein [Mesorhizobium sp. B2-4-6]|uniref:outer membrane protein n=1 Tax=Mesorhizobium sp. B2-4-6 TaxID=2589943 RepID=UPI001129A7C1|nr:outer membrane protein [Mesorhizobium sp. B2-4-6]TPL40239.1 porin family protein [Mesorhizobium sp. B2-4-6]